MCSVTGANAQIATNNSCDAVKSIVKETAIEEGVSAHVMAIESLRFEGSIIITRYSATLSQSTNPETLAASIRRKSESAGYSVKINVLAANKFLVLVSAEAVPCVELLCITQQPLPPSFNAATAPAEDNTPHPDTSTDIEEMEKVLERGEQTQAPDSPVSTSNTEDEFADEKEHKSLVAAILALKRRTEMEVNTSETDQDAAAPKEGNSPQIATSTTESEDKLTPQPDISPIPDAQVYEQELMQRPETILLEVPDTKKETLGTEKPLPHDGTEAAENISKAPCEEKPEMVPVPEPETVPVPEPETVPVPEPETVPVPEPETVPVPEPETVPVPEPEAVPVPEPETVPVPEPEAVPVPEPETVPVNEPETVPVNEPETATMAEPEDEVIIQETPEELTPGKIALILDDGGYGGTTTDRE